MTVGFIGGRQLIAASYARTSTESNDSVSIPTQHKANRKYAESIGARVDYEYSEMYTGTKIDRPELAKLRRLVLTRAIDVIIIYTPDRFARRQYVAGYLLHEEIFPNNVALHWSYAGREIRNTPQDLNMFNIEQNEAENERNKLLERTGRGRKGLLEENVWYFANVKYGYRKTGRRRNAVISINEDEAAVIRWIFNGYDEGKGVLDLVRELDMAKVPLPYENGSSTWSFHRKWQRTTIYRILRDEAYLGRFYYNTTRMVDGKKVLKPKEEQSLMYRPDLAIIEEAQFFRVQERLNNGRTDSSPFKGEYLLARRLKCGFCNSGIQSTQGGKRTRKRDGVKVHFLYYKCYRNLEYGNHSYDKCEQPSWSVMRVDAKAWEVLERFILDPEYRKETLESARLDQFDHNAATLVDIESSDRVIARHDAEIMKLTDLYLADGLTKPQFLAKKKELDDRLAVARKVRSDYEDNLTDVLTDKDLRAIDKDMEMLASALERLGELDFSKRRALVEAMGITGEIGAKDGWYVLRLFAYGYNFTDVPLRGEISSEESATR